MLLIHIISFMVCAGLLASASTLKLRADDASHTFSLYAYGTDITPGLPLFYGDGKAYIGTSTPSWLSEGVNITLTSTDDDTTFVAAPSSSSTNWTTTPMMYIDTTSDAFQPVGFTSTNSSLSDGQVTSGFGLYGGWAMHLADDGTVEMGFYAVETNVTDVYEVLWNAATATPTTGTAIALRTIAPAVVS
ncbi:uncharacterized protein BDZ99DRAFT_464860 [Mytilinidion resinicola]|uniref:Uncharacterized protein n=1 Tax=Mytilinidion resinicola TaxID=574789 RepID=A0A6A6YHA1_9PEZI|nr:uncharacterized protein BDZ99DRAFT_464860 [Mytilinidion resinicola]KAF2807958.1 hypothetical protein BDZ99DRAFT_464860 [Mytilinidion resinicola]